MTETGEMTKLKRAEMCRKSLKPDKLDSRFCGNDGILGFWFVFAAIDGILGFGLFSTAMMGF
ncbi:hypothetical protein GC067_09115 [Neisseria meningitidis]|uniref:hypothetical protein n=1 Tax=Neisseria meningitidis TaxID=487 RepID=UPI0018CBEE22|nr:hypothetical protein [Neisseria meningitidis]MBG8961572.1 hypothetical protein [Neisseria meningitidis]